MPRNYTDVVPAEFVAAQQEGSAARTAWARDLRTLVDDILARWTLRLDGSSATGEAGVVIPVRTSSGTSAALKFQMPGLETTAAILGLRCWNGQGMVQLLDSDAECGAILLERLHGDRSLDAVASDDEATLVVAQLLAKLHSVSPPSGLPQLETVATEMVNIATASVGKLAANEDRGRLLRWRDIVADLRSDADECLLHWDLHFGNVLAADREPWLGIDPEPLVGDPGFDIWPALDSGWSRDPGCADASDIVRRRFHLLTEVLQLDRDRAAGWTCARLMQNTLWDLEDGHTVVPPAAKLIDDVMTSA